MDMQLLNHPLVIKGREFAYRYHNAINHKRKYTGAPYTDHLDEVVNILLENVPWVTPEMLTAAYLHDTVEDTAATIEVIYVEFGNAVGDLVEMLTDVSKPLDGKREIRKAIDREHSARASYEGQTIKYSDLISNTRTIAQYDKGFARGYLKEKEALLKIMNKGDANLLALAWKVLGRAKIRVYTEPSLSEEEMGGNALKVETSRIERMEYERVCTQVTTALKENFPDAAISVIPSYENKPSFGDLDVLIAPEDHTKDIFDLASVALNATEGHKNGSVMSFGIRLPRNKSYFDRIFQVDLIKVPHIWWPTVYFGYNDLGNLMGRVSKKLGFKYGHDGLWCILRDNENSARVIDEILVTNEDLPNAFKLIGYDFDDYTNWSFKEPEDIYEYAASNKYFDLSVYLLENRPHHERIRDRKRKIYRGFLEWCEKQTFAPVPEEYKDVAKLRAEKLKEAFERFPDFEERYTAALAKHELMRTAKKNFNGLLVIEVTGLQGKKISEIIQDFKKAWMIGDAGDDKHFYHWAYTAGPEEVRNVFVEWWNKEKHRFLSDIEKAVN